MTTTAIKWKSLILLLPVLLRKNGDYIYFGIDDKDCTPYTIARATIGWRDCWIISENGEDSASFLMECSAVTDGYIEDLEQWFSSFCVEAEDEIFVEPQIISSVN